MPTFVPDNATKTGGTMRVLYSFPHKIGAERICETAWQQVAGVHAAGATVLVYPGAVSRPLPEGIRVQPTLARGRLRIPYRVLGHSRAFTLHDRVVARRLRSIASEVDLVHTWPSGALKTLRTANELGIPTVLERPNSHTRVAVEVVRRESERLGVELPTGSEHALDEAVLKHEEEEFRVADHLLCPSDFVRQTFLDEGYPPEKLLRHAYGFDDRVFHPAVDVSPAKRPFTALFAGYAAVRKGLHYALEAWRDSAAHASGKFLIAGSILPAYEAKLHPLLDQPGVVALGHRTDVAELMRDSDILVLPSLEEGSPLAVLEALGSGCVPVVSDVCGDACRHGENALVHRVGDVEMLSKHIDLVHNGPTLLARLREGAITSAPSHTWKAAGRRLFEVYAQALDRPPAQTGSGVDTTALAEL